MTLAIVRPGLLSTVQDLGRVGQGAFGVPPAGAMDAVALRLANRLVGNDESLAALEITLAGPEIRFEKEAWVALAGSRFEATVGGRAAPHGESFAVRAGETLTIGKTTEGARAVLAIAGGIDVPVVLGSRSTLLAAGFGGFEGRALRGGDRVPIGPCGPVVKRRLRRDALVPYSAEPSLRVVMGPQAEAFTAAGRAAFLSTAYLVSPRSDRMGMRLQGERIEHAGSADLLPEGIAAGAIQVPADGQPIVLGADRPTTGGYAKIGTVITVDLPLVAQAKPGDRLRFAAVDADEARALYRRHEDLLRSAVEDVT